LLTRNQAGKVSKNELEAGNNKIERKPESKKRTK
jgi:hypothetical protein